SITARARPVTTSQCKSRVLPHPCPLPLGAGEFCADLLKYLPLDSRKLLTPAPSPSEGERVARRAARLVGDWMSSQRSAFAIGVACIGFLASLARAESPVRGANEAVNDSKIRMAAGLKPDGNLLFNGWGVTRAGEHVRISDLPLKMVVSP